MDPIELLREDHHRARQLLTRLQSPAANATLRMHLYAELRRELELHASIEHDLFYPILLGDRRNRLLLDVAERDHQTIAKLLAQLDAIPVESPQWVTLLSTLREAFDEHAKREEETLFERTYHLISAEKRHEVALAMLEQRERQVGIRGSVSDLLLSHRNPRI